VGKEALENEAIARIKWEMVKDFKHPKSNREQVCLQKTLELLA
jgi:hypothetical protein